MLFFINTLFQIINMESPSKEKVRNFRKRKLKSKNEMERRKKKKITDETEREEILRNFTQFRTHGENLSKSKTKLIKEVKESI